jgi:hypothetical protein
MRKKKDTRPVELSTAAKLAKLAHTVDKHTTEAEIDAAITEAVATIIGDNSIAREAALFALLSFLRVCEDSGNTLSARAASIAFSYTDIGTAAELATWRQWAEQAERQVKP